MSRPVTSDRRPKVTAQTKPVGLAVIRSTEGALLCSCEGFVTVHPRAKVRESKAQAHLDKRHGGRGVWL